MNPKWFYFKIEIDIFLAMMKENGYFFLENFPLSNIKHMGIFSLKDTFFIDVCLENPKIPCLIGKKVFFLLKKEEISNIKEKNRYIGEIYDPKKGKFFLLEAVN